ncbi:bacteriohemerythrin [Herbaspirillum sp. HC18]|nr:bacteriohemerythrin [Herbaspirillum sp. HC18]
MSNLSPLNERDLNDFIWTEDLAVGDERIDADHRAIFDIAHRLQAELLDEPEHSIVGEVLVELIDYTGEHFEREEARMRAMKFAEYEEHKAAHSVLMHKVNNLHRRFMDGHGNLFNEVSEFLREALVPHIMTADTRLGRGMREAK